MKVPLDQQVPRSRGKEAELDRSRWFSTRSERQRANI